jgi:hypothetical protein
MNISDWIGFIGVFLILIAYFLNEINQITNKDIAFILLNLIGASLACLASILINYVPFILLEAAWALVSLVSLINYLKKKPSI